MYIGLSEEQKKLRHELRAYYERLLTPAVREDLASEHGIGPKTRAIRQQMAKDGWLCFGWPKEYGGQGRATRSTTSSSSTSRCAPRRPSRC